MKCVWPARISRIEITSELTSGEGDTLDGPTSTLLNRHAGAFSSALRQLLQDLPLAWTTNPQTGGVLTDDDGRSFASYDLLGIFAEQDGPVAFAGMDSEDAIELWSKDGARLLPCTTSALQPLVSRGSHGNIAGAGVAVSSSTAARTGATSVCLSHLCIRRWEEVPRCCTRFWGLLA